MTAVEYIAEIFEFCNLVMHCLHKFLIILLYDGKVFAISQNELKVFQILLQITITLSLKPFLAVSSLISSFQFSIFFVIIITNLNSEKKEDKNPRF